VRDLFVVLDEIKEKKEKKGELLNLMKNLERKIFLYVMITEDK